MPVLPDITAERRIALLRDLVQVATVGALMTACLFLLVAIAVTHWHP